MNLDAGTWHFLTGEYPPRVGGISDYCRVIAEGLADVGGNVHVWTTICDAEPRLDSPHSGVTVHRENSGWTSRDFAVLGRALDAFESPRHLFVQYAPNAFHRTGLSFALARWLGGRRLKGDHIHLMVHEVTYIVKPGDSLRRRLLALAQRRLVASLLRSADSVDIAIPYWERILRPLDRVTGRKYRWLPVGSNVRVLDDPGTVASIRRRLGPSENSLIIGSFGTFAGDVVALLAAVMPSLLLAQPNRAGILIGRGSQVVAEAWLRAYPELAGRLHATGPLDHADLSRYLQACDLLVQPFPGGVCSKRTSLMAGLLHGVATITTSGEVTEPIWTQTSACALADEGDAAAMIAQAETLLHDREARAHVARAGLVLYNNRFASRHTIEALLTACKEPTTAETVRS